MHVLMIRHGGGGMSQPQVQAIVDGFVDRLRALVPSLDVDETPWLDEGALAAIESRAYDLVVLVQAPGGITAETDFGELLAELARIHATAPRVPVLYAAVNGNEWLAAAAIKQGATDYLPLALAEDDHLVRAVKTCLGGGRSVPRQSAEGRERGRRRSPSGAAGTARGAGEAPRVPGARAQRVLDDAPDIPGYRMVRLVGEGGTATTWLALDERRQRHVVIKFMNYLEGLGGLDNVRVFQREYAVIAAMNDRRVVKVYDSGVREDGAFLVVEYFPGGDLGRRMRRPITPHAALTYARQIAQALRLIHTHGIFHRDLKPGNVMLREDGTVALIDFGLAKLPVGQTIAQRGRVLGTPSYLSPEQATGRPVTAASDIYSLGCVLFEMLSGERPYRAESAIRMIDQHVRGPIPQLPPSLAHLQPLIDRMLAKSPGDRFQNAEAVIDAVEEAQRALPLGAAAV